MTNVNVDDIITLAADAEEICASGGIGRHARFRI